MTWNRTILSALLLVVATTWSDRCPAQKPGKPNDEALDSLIEKLAEPKADADRPSTRPDDADKPKKPAQDSATSKSAKDEVKPAVGKQKSENPGAGEVADKDKELDDLLEKLGETKDEPAPRERPGGPPHGGKPADESRPGGGKSEEKPRGEQLRDKDKEIDDRLEEYAGKKRKKNQQQQEEGSGPLGQIIKEMRDVEQRLSKPETGGDTQAKQKQIVKQIETLIHQVKQSNSQRQMAMKMARQQGQKPDDQPKDNTGANAGGPPATKPGTPPGRHALAGGKSIWGHLPAELRQEMENVFKEDALPAKFDLIKRYYLSVAKGKPQRGN